MNFCAETAGAWKFIGEVIFVIRIIIPILIILLGTIDLGKAVLAGEEKVIKEAQKSFIRRLIYGVAIFFVFAIVKVVFSLLGLNLDQGDNKICWECATKPHSQVCQSYVEDAEVFKDNGGYKYNDDYDNNSGSDNSADVASDDELDEL